MHIIEEREAKQSQVDSTNVVAEGSRTSRAFASEREMKSFRAETINSLATSASRRSRISTMSAPMPVRIGAPTRAFVINVRQLISAQETLSLLHELIKSTAIAALTLVNAGSLEQFRTTVCFLVSSIMIFVLHQWHWDDLEIEDFAMLMPLLSDDDDEIGMPNPNRLLKAMTVTQSNVWKWISRCLHVLCVAVATMAWIICSQWWSGEATSPFMAWIQSCFVATEEDGLVLGMQLSVCSLMFFLHLLFEFFYHNETCVVMPRTANSGIWDPRTDGLPWRLWLLGLPSMWFTSMEVLDDLKHWIDKAIPTKVVADIHPQEIAYYALSGTEQRQTVQHALKCAKLFDGEKREFIERSDGGPPEALNIELCFFDDALHAKDCPYPGDFLCMMDFDGQDEDALDVAKSSVRLVARKAGPSAIEPSSHELQKLAAKKIGLFDLMRETYKNRASPSASV